MPYTHKKVGNKYVVYKHGKKVGETEGTKKALDKYLAALHINEPKKKSLKENAMMEEHFDHPGCEDTIGKIFVVLKPHPEASPEDMVQTTHAFGMGQYDPQGIHGVYNDEEEANMVAESAHRQLHKHLAEVEKKKDHILGKISGHIDRLQKEVNSHMKEAAENPELTDKHHELAERKMASIRDLRNKHKVITASKKELPKKEEK